MALEIKKDYFGGFPKIEIAGDPDDLSVKELTACVRHHFAIGSSRYYIELAGLTYLDSTLIGYLLSLHISFSETGEHLVFINPDETVQDLFQKTNLDKILNIEYL